MPECPVCGFVYCEESQLRQHVWASHLVRWRSLRRTRRQCWCGARWLFSGNFDRHLDSCGGLIAHYLECILTSAKNA